MRETARARRVATVGEVEVTRSFFARITVTWRWESFRIVSTFA